VVLSIGEDFAPHLLGTLQAAWLTEASLEESVVPVA